MKPKTKNSKNLGRPPKPAKERKVYNYRIRLTTGQQKTLMQLSRKQEEPVSVIIRNLIDNYARTTLTK